GSQRFGEPGNLVESGMDLVGVMVTVEPDRFGLVLVGVAEDADGVEPCFSQELREDLDVGFSLAGEADDEVAAGSRERAPTPHLFQQTEEPLGVSKSSHSAQYRTRRMLKG